ncbi:caspase domain-containing protein [Daldinia eschscholtzii]|nr:caspase domain-containing protein [Daldinia eschscholtzii]
MTGTKWALLIGVDKYEDPVINNLKRDINGSEIQYKDLHGAVSDVKRVREHLLNYMQVDERHIRLLVTEPRNAKIKDPASSNSKPTYYNIKQALDWILHIAKKDDLVYFHYSGHGGQATTVFPDLKGSEGLDEALVPTDVNNGGRYLRDVEMTLWLRKMVEKGLVVTVVLDSCHSGSATRCTSTARCRDIPQTYKSVLEDHLPSQFIEELAYHGIESKGVQAKNMMRNYWLVEPRGYSLLAACLPRQSAWEDQDENGYHGILTHRMLDILRKYPSISMGDLCRRIRTNIEFEKHDQTPIAGGTIDRSFFGNNLLPTTSHILVKGPSSIRIGENLKLGGGMLHDIFVGSEYDVVKVKHISWHKADAIFMESLNSDTVKPGHVAVLTKVPTALQSLVYFALEADHRLADVFQEALENIPVYHRAWLQVVHSDCWDLAFRIDVNNSGEFEIQERGSIVLADIAPPLVRLTPETPGWAERLFYRLRHIAIFNRVLGFKNFFKNPLHDAVKFEVENPKKGPNGEVLVEHGDTISLRIENKWKDEIFCLILNLDTLFGITQFYPQGGGCEQIDAGACRGLQACMKIPNHVHGSYGIGILKIFAAPEYIDLGILEMPDLVEFEDGRSRDGSGRRRQSSLPRRAKLLLDEKEICWTTKEIDIKVYRKEAEIK